MNFFSSFGINIWLLSVLITFVLGVTLWGCSDCPTITDPHDPNQTVTVNFESKRGGITIYVNGDSIGSAPQQMIFECGDTLSVKVE